MDVGRGGSSGSPSERLRTLTAELSVRADAEATVSVLCGNAARGILERERHLGAPITSLKTHSTSRRQRPTLREALEPSVAAGDADTLLSRRVDAAMADGGPTATTGGGRRIRRSVK